MSRVYGQDGHRSAKVMVRHVAQMSPAAAVRWAQSAAMGATLPRVAAAHAAGEVGTCQVARLGRLGDAATVDDLARTDAQRRADATLALAEQGATVIPGHDGASFVTGIVIDHHIFQRELALLAGITL